MQPSLESISSLVVRCPNWVGDVVMATPVFQCLRDNFPEATITALIRPYVRGIIEDSPWFDAIVDCQDRTLRGVAAIRRALSRSEPQLGLLLTNTTHSWLSLKAAGVPWLVGYRRNLRRFLIDGPAPLRDNRGIKPVPMQQYYLELCRWLGLRVPPHPKATLPVSSELVRQGRERLRGYGVTDDDLLIGLNPGAAFGASKCWPPDYFAELAQRMQSTWQCKLLLLVGPGEEAIASRITATTGATIINTAADAIGLAELKPLIRRCNLLITNDTGPRHYAAALDVPLIVLMGPTDPVYTASNLEHTTVLRRDLPCAPCHKKTCPLGHHDCMNGITPSMVMEAAAAIVERRPVHIRSHGSRPR